MLSERDIPQRFSHRLNLTRYRKMLAGHLTTIERDFVERRVEEEQEAMRKLSRSGREPVPTRPPLATAHRVTNGTHDRHDS
jgi:hypothetical protein